MYRIHFDPKIGRFIVQVLAFGFIWVSVQKLADSNDKTEPLTFTQFDEATSHVKTIGLDKLYRDKSENQFRAHMTGRRFELMTDSDGNEVSYHAFGKRMSQADLHAAGKAASEKFYTGPGVQHG